MSDIFTIHINGSGILFLLFVLLFSGLVYWLYRTTWPPSGSLIRNTLMVLRVTVVVLVVMMLFEPVLTRVVTEKEYPSVAVLIDRSKSISLKDAEGGRSDKVLQWLKHPVWQELGQRTHLHYFTFADTTEESSAPWDSIRFDGWMTDMNGALERVRRTMNGKNLTAMIMITDGQYNYGASPLSFAELSDVPVHLVGVGDTTEPRDIAVTQVIANTVAYAGQKIAFDVMMTAAGFKGQSVTLQLFSEKKLLATKTVPAPEEGSTANAQFEIMAGEEGEYKYEILAVPQAGEIITDNNRRSVMIRVLKSRFKILLISGEPGPDQSFLYQQLSIHPDFLVRALVQKPDGRFIPFSEEASLTDRIEDYDVFIFNQYPTSSTSDDLYRSVTEHIRTTQKPWMFFYGPAVDMKKYESLKNAGGVEFRAIANLRDQPVYLRLTPQGKNSAVMLMNASSEQTERYWSELPPMWIDRMIPVSSGSSAVLARADMGRAPQMLRLAGDIPLILSRHEKKQKTLTVAFYGFWKSHFTPIGFGKPNPVYSRFLDQSVRWLALSEDLRPVSVATHKTIYPVGEKTLITGQVYDEQSQPVSDAIFRVTVRSSSGVWTFQLNSAGNGRYSLMTGPFPVGDYTVSAEAEGNGALLGKDEKKFSVEPFSPELLKTTQNRELLKGMAKVSGGKYLTTDQAEEFARLLNGGITETEHKYETDLWNQTILLFVLTALLAVEWWIRKRHEML